MNFDFDFEFRTPCGAAEVKIDATCAELVAWLKSQGFDADYAKGSMTLSVAPAEVKKDEAELAMMLVQDPVAVASLPFYLQDKIRILTNRRQ